MTCDLCGRLFEVQKARAVCLGSCGSVKTCAGVRCPYCFYEMIPKPAWLQKLSGFFSRFSEQPSKTDSQSVDFETESPLSEFKMNVETEILGFRTKDDNQIMKLIALGVLPGTKVVLLQRFPSFVFQIGFIQFSIDRELASVIWAKRVG